MTQLQTPSRPAALPGLPDAAWDPVPAIESLQIDAGNLARDMAAELLERVPEFRNVDDRDVLFMEVQACCRANINEVLQLLQNGWSREAEIHIPRAAHAFTVSIVHRRIAVGSLLRAYRIGHNHLWNALSERADVLFERKPETTQMLGAVSSMLFDYIDGVSEAHAAIHDAERERWSRSADALRMETITELLDGSSMDAGSASQRLGYDLRTEHIAFIVAANPARAVDTTTAALMRTANAIGRTGGALGALSVPVGTSVVWGWISPGPGGAADLLRNLETYCPPDGHSVAIGRIRGGTTGFRVSHQEARHAAAFVAPGTRSTTSYQHVELVSLLVEDRERAHRFVRDQLGKLASSDESAIDLRDTVLAFLDLGGSYVAAANTQYLHKNTVYTRVRRAERILGRAIAPGDTALHTALALCTALPDLTHSEFTQNGDGADEPGTITSSRIAGAKRGHLHTA